MNVRRNGIREGLGTGLTRRVFHLESPKLVSESQIALVPLKVYCLTTYNVIDARGQSLWKSHVAQGRRIGIVFIDDQLVNGHVNLTRSDARLQHDAATQGQLTSYQ